MNKILMNKYINYPYTCLKGFDMAKITIYINSELESKVKKIANSLNISISKYIATMVEKISKIAGIQM